MPPQTASTSDMWGAIRQGIAEAVPRNLRGRVVSDALALAGLAGPPDTAEAVRTFVSGPLFLALAAVLGTERATQAGGRIADLIAVCAKQRLAASTDDGVLASLELRSSGVRVASARRARHPTAVAQHEVVFVGPDASREPFSAIMRAVHARVVLPNAASAPVIAVVVEPAGSTFDLARACQRRWPHAVVLAWCDPPGDQPAPEGVAVVPVPHDRPEEVAMVCRAHLSARGVRAG